MIPHKKYLLTTPVRQEGIVYMYNDKGLFCGVQIKEILAETATQFILDNIKMKDEELFDWVKENSKNEYKLVQLHLKISFMMFWDKYNDKNRSSKKRSEKLWGKLSEADQVKAFYYYDTYNRNRGNAEKKYCETYLGAEMWNN